MLHHLTIDPNLPYHEHGETQQIHMHEQGHTATIEDVGYMPQSSHELVSVGDDNAMLLWDTRTGATAASRVDQAHGDNDLHCVDWSGCDTSYIATGEGGPCGGTGPRRG